MNPTYTMDDQQWLTLIEDVAKLYNDVTIKRGFQYYKQGHVQRFTMINANRIEAEVEGSELYRVVLLLDKHASSYCTCPVESSCKHMIAALLEYASLQERSVYTIVNAHTTVSFKQAAKPLGQASLPERNRRMEETLRLREQASQLSTLTIPQWHSMFERCIKLLTTNLYNAQDTKEAVDAIYSLKPQLPLIQEQLFELHTHLIVLEKLIRSSQASAMSLGYYTQVAADDILGAIQRILGAELPLTAESDSWERLSETVTYLRNTMLIESRFYYYFSQLYYLFWRNWIAPNTSDTKLYSRELRMLEAAETAVERLPSKPGLLLAKSWMHFFMKQDQEAWSFIQAASSVYYSRPNELLSFLQALFQGKEWARLIQWLVEIGPLLDNPRNNSMREYLYYWETAVEHLPEAEPQLWDTLVRMLPGSRAIYEESLHTYGKWQQWMDYQLNIGKDPLEFRVSVLQPIEKQAPEVLLPFYHQAVERYVLEKNRSSYKAAVKLLKRLAKLYKKMKQEERWELFLDTFAGRHSRLRALQEELRRGKLLS